MGLILIIFIAFAAISLFASVLQYFISFRKGNDLLFLISGIFSSIVFFHYLTVVISSFPEGMQMPPMILLKLELVLGQFVAVCMIGVLYHLLQSMNRKRYLVVNLVLGSLSILTIVLPSDVLFGSKAAIDYYTLTNGQTIPLLTGQFTLFHAIKNVTLAVLIIITFTILVNKLSEVSFRTVSALFAGIIIMTFAAIYDFLIDLHLITSFYIVPFAVFLYYLILTFVVFVIFIEDIMLKNKIILQEKKWQKLINDADIIVVELNRMGSVVSVNPYFCKLSGYRHDEILGKDWFEFFIPSKDFYDVQGTFVDVLENEFQPVYINPIITRNKQEKVIQWYNVRTYDHRGKISGSLSIGIDITDIANDRDILKQKLSEAERMIARLSSSPGHD